MRLNQNPLKEIIFNDFGGGYAGAKGVGSLANSEALDLDNIIISPSGAGFRNRQGNHELRVTTTSTGWSEWNNVVGLGTFKNSTAEYVIFAMVSDSDSDIDVFDNVLDTQTTTSRATMTGTFTQDSLLTLVNFQNKVIGVGGHGAPIKVVPGASGGALGGSPPSGTVALAWNNVFWIGNTTSDPSKLYYSILNDPEDWSSSGSGFVNPQPGDGDELTAIAPISNNILLYYKNRTIFQVVGRADPFAVYPLFQNVGCAGKHAIVATEGLHYFITPDGRMRITDGNKIYDDRDIPALSNADDLWNQVPKSRLPYIEGFRQQGNSFDHIVWMVSLGATATKNNYAIVWDLKNKCWLKRSTGFNGNAVTKSSAGRYFIGTYVGGRIDELEYSGVYADDSEGTPTFSGGGARQAVTDPLAFRWFWRTDELSMNSLENIIQVDRVNILTQLGGTGTVNMSYGYDGFYDQDTKNMTIVPFTFVLGTSILGVDILGGSRSTTKTIRPLGRGNTFNFKMDGISAVATEITKFTLSGRQAATKVSEVR